MFSHTLHHTSDTAKLIFLPAVESMSCKHELILEEEKGLEDREDEDFPSIYEEEGWSVSPKRQCLDLELPCPEDVATPNLHTTLHSGVPIGADIVAGVNNGADSEDMFERLDHEPRQFFADFFSPEEKAKLLSVMTFAEHKVYKVSGPSADIKLLYRQLEGRLKMEDGTLLMKTLGAAGPLTFPTPLGRAIFGPPHTTEFYQGDFLPVCEFKGALKTHNPNQQEICDILIQNLREGERFESLQSPTGSGKTVMMCYLVWKLGVKAIFICKSKKLIEQAMKDGFGAFLPTLKLGILEGSSKAVLKRCEDCDVILTTPKTLATGKVPETLLKKFGVVVCDEAHQLGINEMLKASDNLATKFRIGVTATFRRNDDKIGVVAAVCGELALSLQRKPKPMHYFVHVLNYDTKTKEMPVKMQQRGLYRDRPDANDFTEKITQCGARAEIICNLIAADLAAIPGYKIMVFATRVLYLLLLQQLLKEKHQIDAGVLYQKIKGDKLVEAKSKRVILSTRQSGIEGINDKDILYIYSVESYSNSANLVNEQGFGRHRDSEGKGELVVRDFVDNSGLCWAQFRTRQKFMEGFVTKPVFKYIQNIHFDPRSVKLPDRDPEKLFLDQKFIAPPQNQSNGSNIQAGSGCISQDVETLPLPPPPPPTTTTPPSSSSSLIAIEASSS
jgi:hypothetical protein